MAKSLVITEKPSVARDIAAALGGFREEDGWFESDDYVVTFAVGHLFELLPPEEIDPKYKRWTLDVLPILPKEFKYKAKQGQSERIRTIKKLLNRADVNEVINACDAGREGELIFREIVEDLGSKKPIRRLWLQSMTAAAIRAGFRSLRPGRDLEGLATAAACRARSDWLIGMNATRALTKRLKSRKEKTAWSAGRVQTPTLAMLVGRELEILGHVPRPYWQVTASFEHAGATYTGQWFDPGFAAGDDAEARDDRIFEPERAPAIVARVSGQRGAASETRKPSRESAPPLFDLTSLQREGNRRFGWSARRTLSAAQRLYERHKLLTYPRTDSRCLPSDYREAVRETLGTLAAADPRPGEGFQDWAAAASRLLEGGLENEARVFDDTGVSDHFAIVPTGSLPETVLTGDDKRLFDLVVRRFLGAFHPPAVWERVERVTEVAGESFRTRARFLQEKGWRSVLPATSDEDAGEVTLRPLLPGESEASGVPVALAQAEATAEQTKPPPRITEARLLSLMENAGQQIEDEDLAAVLHEKGIGTPATRADIIENLIAKGYVVRVDKALRPAVKGIRLIDTLQRIHIDRLTSPQLTGEIESHLIDVERGRRTAKQFMNEIAEYATEIVDRAKSFEYDELYDANESLGPCPRCGRPVIEMAWFYRCRPVEGQPPEQDCPMRFWKDTSGRYLDRNTVQTLLEDGKTPVIDGFTARNGRTYRAHLEIDREAWQVKVRSAGWDEAGSVIDVPEYDVNPEPVGRCPFDEDCQVVESPTQFICERALKDEGAAKDESQPRSCGFVFPRTICKREITRDEAAVYVTTGKTELLTDFTSRFGRPFAATLVLKKNGRHGFEFQPRGGAQKEAQREGDAAPAGAAETPAAKPPPRRRGARKPSPLTAKVVRKKSAARKPARGAARARSARPTAKPRQDR
jgi:DNA topoisomerase-3